MPVARRTYARRAPAKRTTVRRAATRTVTGHGAYKSKKSGGGGRHYYDKYRALKASHKSESSSGGWLAPALGAVGSALIPGIGGPIGSGLGSLIKSVTGFGDYEVKENSLLLPEAGDPPMVVNSANKSVIIRHREYLDDIISSPTAGAFSLQNFYINPGDRITFPWLSQLADSFEHYRIRGMIFEFRTMSSDALNSTNTALGQVIMATSYNSALPNFTNKYEMENYEFGVSIKPSCSLMHPIECAKSQSVLGDLYVRPTLNVPSGSDRRLYDFGNFQIATNGLQGTSVNVGELWVTYEVELFKPKVITEDGTYIPWVNMTASTSQLGTVDQTHPFGTTVGGLASAADEASTVSVDSDADHLYFHNLPAADYRFNITWTGATAAYGVTAGQVDVVLNNLPQYPAELIGSVIYTPSAYNTQANTYSISMHIRVLTTNSDLRLRVFPAGASPPSGGGIVAELVQIPQNSGN